MILGYLLSRLNASAREIAALKEHIKALEKLNTSQADSITGMVATIAELRQELTKKEKTIADHPHFKERP